MSKSPSAFKDNKDADQVKLTFTNHNSAMNQKIKPLNKAESNGMNSRMRGKNNSQINFKKNSNFQSNSCLDAIESDKEGEDLITSSLQKL